LFVLLFYPLVTVAGFFYNWPIVFCVFFEWRFGIGLFLFASSLYQQTYKFQPPALFLPLSVGLAFAAIGDFADFVSGAFFPPTFLGLTFESSPQFSPNLCGSTCRACHTPTQPF